MIYIVECGFADPAREAEWNRFYSGPKLAALLDVPGFQQSQRFQDTEGGAAPYFAVHEVVSAEFLATASYQTAGGGSFLHYQPYITNWRRTIFSGLDRLEEVLPNQRLIVIDSEPVAVPGIEVHWLRPAGLGHLVPSRGLAAVSKSEAAQLKKEFGSSLRILKPISALMHGRQ